MGAPATLLKLTKGKLIDVQEGFVDTFNFLVDFVNNLKGEGDLDKSKKLTVDRSIPDFPVIRGGVGGSGNADGESIDVNYDEELEIKGFSTEQAESDSIAQFLTTQKDSNSGHNVIERYGNVKYRNYGGFIAGDDTNIVFSDGSDGQVKIDIYYS